MERCTCVCEYMLAHEQCQNLHLLLLFFFICQRTNNPRSSQADTITWNIRLHKLIVETSTKKCNTGKWRNLVSLLRETLQFVLLAFDMKVFSNLPKNSQSWFFFFPVKIVILGLVIKGRSLPVFWQHHQHCSFSFLLSPKYWAVPDLKLEF